MLGSSSRDLEKTPPKIRGRENRKTLRITSNDLNCKFFLPFSVRSFAKISNFREKRIFSFILLYRHRCFVKRFEIYLWNTRRKKKKKSPEDVSKKSSRIKDKKNSGKISFRGARSNELKKRHDGRIRRFESSFSPFPCPPIFTNQTRQTFARRKHIWKCFPNVSPAERTVPNGRKMFVSSPPFFPSPFLELIRESNDRTEREEERRERRRFKAYPMEASSSFLKQRRLPKYRKWLPGKRRRSHNAMVLSLSRPETRNTDERRITRIVISLSLSLSLLDKQSEGKKLKNRMN